MLCAVCVLLAAGPPAGARAGALALTDGLVGCSTSDDAYPFALGAHTPGAAIDLLPEGNYPYDATITPDGAQVWLVGASGDGVVVIDRATNAVVARFPVAGYAIGVAFTSDGTRAMVTSRDEDCVKIVDTATYAVVGTLPIPSGYLGAGNIALDPVGERFYVVDWYDAALFEIAGDGSAVLRQADLGDSLWQVVVAPDGDHVYVTDRGTDEVLEVDTATLTVARRFAVGDDPWGLDITADGQTLVVTCEDSNEVVLVGLVSGGTVTVTLDASADPRDVDILDADGLAYVAGGTVSGFSSAVYVIDVASGLVLDTFDGPGTNSNVIAVQPQMSGGTTSANLPAPAVALRAYPNPFNPAVRIELRLEAPASGVLAIHDLAGRTVRTLASGTFAAGTRTWTWDGRGTDGRALPSGVYLATLRGDGVEVVRKLVLAR
jgi:YVTN family beta-propeller protein